MNYYLPNEYRYKIWKVNTLIIEGKIKFSNQAVAGLIEKLKRIDIDFLD